MKMSCPVALLPDNNPMTRPRRSTNQRLAMTAAITIASAPVLSPMKMPRIGRSSQDRVTSGSSAIPAAIVASAPSMVRRSPKRSMNPAENGPTRPQSIS